MQSYFKLKVVKAKSRKFTYIFNFMIDFQFMIDTEFSHIKDGKWIEVPEIKKIAEQLVERYQYQSEQYNILREENDKLKNGVWEKEEISKLKNERDSYKQQLSFGFGITKEENDKINQWISNRETRNTGAIGGRYEYRFFPTGIGTICKIVDTIDGESFIFRELN